TDPTANSLQEVQQASQLEALGLIPHLDGMLPSVEGFPLAYNTRGEALPPAEAFRTLKTNILFSIPKVRCPVILVTSSDREEGKSTTVINLALAFAEDRRTLVLSCNMRRPTLHRVVGVSEQRGMHEILDKDLPWEQAVRRTRYPNLYFVPHGRIAHNSSVLLGRTGFARLIEEAREAYEVVLIDSPPATILIDAAVIATKADATLLVYALGETHKDQLKRAAEVTRKVDANLVGVAVNTKSASLEPSRRYYDYHQDKDRKK
ncbi:MAG: CpsD/CapB family tyrosine-protein kinase, partial [Planctomycetota bacterium]